MEVPMIDTFSLSQQLNDLYIQIGSQDGQPTDEQLAEVHRIENILYPPKEPEEWVYRCSTCGSEWCTDEGRSWDCSARAGGCPEDV